MKRKFVCGITLCLALSMAGCGKDSKEQQAMNYYQNELGLDKDEAEELAHELYGDDDEELNVTEEEPKEITVEPLPELLDSEWYEQKVQIYDMIFCNDWYMTEDDIRRAAEESAYNVELTEDFDENGNVVLRDIMIDGKQVAQVWKSTRGYASSSWVEVNDMVLYGLLDDGEYYIISYGSVFMRDNWYDKESTEFADLKTRDDVLKYLAENGFVEVEKEQSTYPSYDEFFSIDGFINVYTEDSPVEFADTPYYYSQGVQSITFYRMHELGRTDQTIEMRRGYGNYIYSGAHLNLVNCVTFKFGTDGTVADMKWGIQKFIVYED